MSSTPPGTKMRRVRLLEADPDLGSGLTTEEFEQALGSLAIDVVELGRGWREPGAVGSSEMLGLLVIDGVLVRTVEVAGRRSGELVGPGAILRPWDHLGDHAAMPFEVGWRVLQTVRLGLLEQSLISDSAQWPALMHAVFARAVGRSHALALNVTINSLQHVELRLLVLFWHLADRFGRVTPEGTVVPLKLSHGDIAELIGARRPSVSTRLSQLSDDGKLARRPDRTWLLRGDPPAEVLDFRRAA